LASRLTDIIEGTAGPIQLPGEEITVSEPIATIATLDPMSSDRRSAANRRNAQKSRGPTTAVGKARVSRNALAHGLAVSIHTDPTISSDVEKLAQVLTDGSADARVLAQARIIAEADYELERVQRAKVSLINRQLSLLTSRDCLPDARPVEVRPSDVSSPEINVLAVAWIKALPDLLRLRRYEHRARSRQRRAMHVLFALKLISTESG
jgi:hypothetical protein